MKKPPARYRGYSFVKQREDDEVPWFTISNLQEAVSILPRPIALINGAFDLLHSGHFKIIHAARDHAKTVICALDSDEKIKQSKGVGRPIFTWSKRASSLNFLPIDCIVEINTDREFIKLVNIIKPNFRVLGSEYLDHSTRIPEIPILFVPNRGLHTSDIIQRCKAI